MLQVLLEVIENVFEPRKIFRRGLAKGLMGIEHLLRLLLFLRGRLGRERTVEDFALRSIRAIGVNVKNLIQPQPGEKVTTPRAAVDHVQMTAAQFLQAESDACHRSHEGRVHHRALLQVDDEFPISATDHLAGEFLQIATVKEIALTLDPDPHGLIVYPDLDR